jgi:hypothetical protein
MGKHHLMYPLLAEFGYEINIDPHLDMVEWRAVKFSEVNSHTSGPWHHSKLRYRLDGSAYFKDGTGCRVSLRDCVSI